MVLHEKKAFDLHIAGYILFTMYLLLLAYVMFLSESLGRTELYEEYHYNLVLFREIRRFIIYRDQLSPLSVLANIGGNVLAFIPFGMFFPYVQKWGKQMWVTVLCGFLLTLFIETAQLLTYVGCFDVDDLLLNTVGAAVGFLIYRCLRGLNHKRKEQTA